MGSFPVMATTRLRQCVSPEVEYFPFSPSPNDVVYDYTASGVRRSIEDSLQRLGIDSIDIAFVHDISSPVPQLAPAGVSREGV